MTPLKMRLNPQQKQALVVMLEQFITDVREDRIVGCAIAATCADDSSHQVNGGVQGNEMPMVLQQLAFEMMLHRAMTQPLCRGQRLWRPSAAVEVPPCE